MMKCPMSFANPDERGAWSDCDERCAWLMEQDSKPNKVCAIAIIAASETDPMGFYPSNDMVDRPETTRMQPDSLQNLLDFVTTWAHPDNIENSSPGDYRDAMAEVKERLSAIIQRGER